MAVVEDTGETTNGWPLGLGIINIRFRAAAQTTKEQDSIEMPSPSFTSSSSSNLDTESTASFFQDQSVPLGRLIGIKVKPAGNRGNSHFHNQITICTGTSFPEIRRRRRSRSRTGPENTGTNGSEETSSQSQQQQSLCVPLLHNVMEKMSRSKSSSRH